MPCVASIAHENAATAAETRSSQNVSIIHEKLAIARLERDTFHVSPRYIVSLVSLVVSFVSTKMLKTCRLCRSFCEKHENATQKYRLNERMTKLMKQETITFRLDPEIRESVESIARKNGLKNANALAKKIVLDALDDGASVKTDESIMLEKTHSLQCQVDALAQTVQTKEQAKSDFTRMANRIDVLCGLILQLGQTYGMTEETFLDAEQNGTRFFGELGKQITAAMNRQAQEKEADA